MFYFLYKMNSYDISDDEANDDAWNEINVVNEIIECIFCNDQYNSIEAALKHCCNTHKFDFNALKKKFNMDCYSFIKFINFVRATTPSGKEILDFETPVWNDDLYLKPVKESDPWLMFDFEEYFNSDTNEICSSKKPELNFEQQILQLQFQLQQKDEQIEELTKQLSQMRKIAQKILLNENNSNVDKNNKHFYVSSNSSYFDSYSHPGIHYDMLSDKIRTISYKTAIIENGHLFKDKIILDLGCGTGILSMFAASVGSQNIYAVDNSDIVYYTADIIKENNLENKITLIKAKIEDEPLSIGEIDIIVSEWMGYFLLFEGMLDSLIYARNRYLKSNGIIVPNECNLFICGANDPEGYKNSVEFWSDVYGFQMTCIKNEVTQEAIIDIMPPEKIVTSVANICSFNLYKCVIADTNFTSNFELRCYSDTTVTTFVGYFNTIFGLDKPVQFCTGPFSHPTHWKQTLFHIAHPIQCKKGDILKGSLTCRRNNSNNRSLLIMINVNNHNFLFNLSQ